MTFGKKENGHSVFGFLGILAALMVIILVTLWAFKTDKNMTATPREKLESLGVELPKNVTIQNAPQAGQAIADEITKGANQRNDDLKCTIDSGGNCTKK